MPAQLRIYCVGIWDKWKNCCAENLRRATGNDGESTESNPALTTEPVKLPQQLCLSSALFRANQRRQIRSKTLNAQSPVFIICLLSFAAQMKLDLKTSSCATGRKKANSDGPDGSQRDISWCCVFFLQSDTRQQRWRQQRQQGFRCKIQAWNKDCSRCNFYFILRRQLTRLSY